MYISLNAVRPSESQIIYQGNIFQECFVHQVPFHRERVGRQPAVFGVTAEFVGTVRPDIGVQDIAVVIRVGSHSVERGNLCEGVGIDRKCLSRLYLLPGE